MKQILSLLLLIISNPASSFHFPNGRAFLKTPKVSHPLRTRTACFSSSSNNQDNSETPIKLVVPGRPTWQQTMLRIADPSKSISFYTETMGMTLIDIFDFPQYKFSIYFLTTLPKGETYGLTPGTQEAHDYTWSMEGTTLELTHNYGTEDSETFKGYHAGNEERDGFGHVAFSCDDVYQATETLLEKDVLFKKKPDEGRMKGLAFAYDPDGYWIELVKRPTTGKIRNIFNFSQTMLRVRDPQKSLAFYQNMGMTLLSERHFDDFSLYYLASDLEGIEIPIEDSSTNDAKNNAYSKFGPLLELTHNHGTEKEENGFEGYFHGNEEGRQGFGHVGFLVDDVHEACDAIREMGYGFRKVGLFCSSVESFVLLAFNESLMILSFIHCFGLGT